MKIFSLTTTLPTIFTPPLFRERFFFKDPGFGCKTTCVIFRNLIFDNSTYMDFISG
jgi:hypothetical protein